MTADPVVTLERVSREYRQGEATVHALRDVSLALRRNELSVVRGRSGSGKTTLLNMIGGLDRPSAGRVEVDGVEVSSLTGDALVDFRRRTVGFVFQGFGLIPILSAAENVEIPLRLRRLEPTERSARARELLHLVDLSHRAHHRSQELSGGEQQRVAIARALANEPPLLIADEPTAQLDSRRAEAIMGVLRQLVAMQGVSVVVATHDPLLFGMADRAVELRDGEVVADSGSSRAASLEAAAAPG